MIQVIAGGKKPNGWQQEAIFEWQKRLKKPYELNWQFWPEEKLAKYLGKWPFSRRDFVIVCDERGKNISSEEFSRQIETAFVNSRNVVILIGGAYGFSDEVRERADLVWSFSKLVFPHALARVIVAEQVYRAQEIAAGHPYHHA